MLLASWYKALLFFLWITPKVILGALGVILWKRRLYRQFPCFLVYVLYEIAQFMLLFILYRIFGVTSHQYAYAYVVTVLCSIVLRFGVIDEISKDLFRESRFLKAAARRSLQGVAGLLLVIGVLFSVYAPGVNSAKWYAGIFVVNRGAAMVQCGLLLVLLLFSRFWGFSWRRHAFGIALGLAILTSSQIAEFALRAAFTNKAALDLLDLLITGTFLVCVSIWIGYLWAPERESAPVAAVPRDEVEAWNKEFQQWLRN